MRDGGERSGGEESPRDTGGQLLLQVGSLHVQNLT